MAPGAGVGVRCEDPRHFLHDPIPRINRVSAGAGVHHVIVKNNARNERFAVGARNACGVTQEPKSEAHVSVTVIDPDSRVFWSEYAEQSAFNGHTDLAGGATGSKAVDVLVMVEIGVSTLAIKAGLSFYIAVQGYAPCGMSFGEFFPCDDDSGYNFKFHS